MILLLNKTIQTVYYSIFLEIQFAKELDLY